MQKQISHEANALFAAANLSAVVSLYIKAILDKMHYQHELKHQLNATRSQIHKFHAEIYRQLPANKEHIWREAIDGRNIPIYAKIFVLLNDMDNEKLDIARDLLEHLAEGKNIEVVDNSEKTFEEWTTPCKLLE